MRHALTICLFAALLLAGTAFAEDKKLPETAMPDKPVCGITGTIVNIEKLEKSAWADGTPSSFSTVAVNITVELHSRYAHNKTAAENLCAKEDIKGVTTTYKLCSPTPIKAGDFIRAVEGLETGNKSATGCLFDVAVMPPAQHIQAPETNK